MFTGYPFVINRNISPRLPDHTPLCFKREMEKTEAQANVTIRDEQATCAMDYQETGKIPTDLYLELQTNHGEQK